MSQRSKSRREQRRSGGSQMPSGSAGLMRFYQDESIGIKLGPYTAIIISILLIVVVILAHTGVLDWLL